MRPTWGRLIMAVAVVLFGAAALQLGSFSPTTLVRWGLVLFALGHLIP